MLFRSDDLIDATIRKHGTDNPEAIVTDCIEEAKNAGGDDNVTVMVLSVLS